MYQGLSHVCLSARVYYIILDEAPVRGQKGQLEYARRHSSKYIVFLEQFRLADELITTGLSIKLAL